MFAVPSLLLLLNFAQEPGCPLRLHYEGKGKNPRKLGIEQPKVNLLKKKKKKPTKTKSFLGN